jgi:hypothetical protein
MPLGLHVTGLIMHQLGTVRPFYIDLIQSDPVGYQLLTDTTRHQSIMLSDIGETLDLDMSKLAFDCPKPSGAAPAAG